MVEGDERRSDPLRVPSLPDLIDAYRRRTGHSYNDMAARVRGEITSQQLQKLAMEPIRQFPKKAGTVQLLSELLDVSVTTVVLAYARSLGLPVKQTGTMLEVTLPPGTEDLTVEDREAVRMITRQLIDARRQGREPEPNYMQVQGLLLDKPGESRAEGDEVNGPAAPNQRLGDG